MGSAARLGGRARGITNGLFYLCPFCGVGVVWIGMGAGGLRTIEPGDVFAKLVAELLGGGMERHASGLGPELELIATAVAFVAVITTASDVHGERTWPLPS
jgi:hypothetical protein